MWRSSRNTVRLFRSPRADEEAAVKVIDILAAKGGDVIGIEPAATLEAAAKLLSTHRIGAVVIRGAGGRLAGILSERDIVRAVAREGAGALACAVGQVMTRDVVTCSENDTCAEIMERMTTHKFRHLPVLRENAIVGLISIGDVVKQRVEEIEQESQAMRDYIRSA
jgi:CBS domain-containing protein